MFLGDEGFVRQMQTTRVRTAEDGNIPTIQQRSPAKPFADMETEQGERNGTMVAAYATGEFR